MQFKTLNILTDNVDSNVMIIYLWQMTHFLSFEKFLLGSTPKSIWILIDTCRKIDILIDTLRSKQELRPFGCHALNIIDLVSRIQRKWNTVKSFKMGNSSSNIWELFVRTYVAESM